MADRLIHLSDWADQPSIRIACDQTYTTPAWGPRSGMTDTPGVYEADDGRLYTFGTHPSKDKLVPPTCPACLALHETEWAEKEG